MAGTRQTNTFGEALQRLLGDLAQMKVLPDADLAWIVDVETKVIGKLREGIDGVAASGASQVPGDPMLGQAIGMQGQMPGGPPQQPQGIPGLRPNPMINADELRRVMGQ